MVKNKRSKKTVHTDRRPVKLLKGTSLKFMPDSNNLELLTQLLTNVFS